MYSCLLYGLLGHVWLLIGWFSNSRDEIEIVAGIATVVASGGSLTHSLNQSINQSIPTLYHTRDPKTMYYLETKFLATGAMQSAPPAPTVCHGISISFIDCTTF